MDLLSAISVTVGVFFVGLVALAVLVAGWELLRQRELQNQLRRDRALYAATSPLPLAAGPALMAAGAIAAGARRPGVPGAGAPARADDNWTQTRPMVIGFAPAADDETAACRPRELDLLLD